MKEKKNKKKAADPTLSATNATESSLTNSTQAQPAPTAAELQPQESPKPQQAEWPELTNEQKQYFAYHAHYLGIDQIVQQVTKLTENQNALMQALQGNAGKTAAATGQMPDFVKGLFAAVAPAIPKIIESITGSGQSQGPQVNPEILNRVIEETRRREEAMTKALTLFADKIAAGATVEYNSQTGEVRINPRQGPQENSS